MISVTEEPDSAFNRRCRERCCFCREHTQFWYVPKDVAVCKACALKANQEDVPDKKHWLRRERIADRDSDL